MSNGSVRYVTVATCHCGDAMTQFDADAAAGLSPAEVRRRWPSAWCGRCATHVWVNGAHFAAGGGADGWPESRALAPRACQ